MPGPDSRGHQRWRPRYPSYRQDLVRFRRNTKHENSSVPQKRHNEYKGLVPTFIVGDCTGVASTVPTPSSVTPATIRVKVQATTQKQQNPCGHGHDYGAEVNYSCRQLSKKVILISHRFVLSFSRRKEILNGSLRFLLDPPPGS